MDFWILAYDDDSKIFLGNRLFMRPACVVLHADFYIDFKTLAYDDDSMFFKWLSMRKTLLLLISSLR